MMKRVLAVVVILTAIAAGCAIAGWLYLSLPVCKTRVLCEGSHVIDAGGFAIDCRPPIRRLRRAGELRIKTLQNGKLDVVLVDIFGNEYKQAAVDKGGGEIGTSFPGISWGRRIRQVRIYSDHPVKCSMVYWNDWNPL